jgi:hypothetical protein
LTEELYDRLETQTALAALEALSKSLHGPFVLIGGWAVYLTALDSFRREHGAPYLGSRDVDIGFHVDTAMSVEALRSGTLARAVDVVKALGYVPLGSFRYCKFVRKGTGEFLTEEAAGKVPMYDLFYLYLDMMVDRIHPRHGDVFSARALDEPVLARVFDEKLGVTVNVGDVGVAVPPPHILLAMKLRSLPARQKDDKILKDACDIYALIWHSSAGYRDVLEMVRSEYPMECESGLKAITDDIAERAARHLGVDVEQYNGVVRRLWP